jgi:astacin
VAWIGSRLRDVRYTVVEGDAVVEGCIVLGPAAKIRRLSEAAEATRLGRDQYGLVITGPEYKWPNRTIPYELAADLPHPDRVRSAVDHWREKVPRLKFIERTAQNEHLYPNWVTFRRSSVCSSDVGCQKGQQFINLGAGCGVGNIIHEIGHAVGLWHEQSREDREDHVEILWDNIKLNALHNFEQRIRDGDDVGNYDYASIMHYPRDAFSANDQDTIRPKSNVQIGQRTGLSAGDIATVNALYA